MHGHARHLAPVAAFVGREDFERLRPLDIGYGLGPVAAFFALCFFAQRREDFLGRDGHFVYADADGIVDGVGDRGHDGQERALSDLFRAERAVRVCVFDQVGLNIAHLKRRRALVFQERWKLVNDVAIGAVGHLFHEGFAEAHVDAAFDLAHDEHGIDGLAYVVADPDALYRDEAGRMGNVDFGDRSRVAVSGRWAHARAFEFSGRARRRV